MNAIRLVFGWLFLAGLTAGGTYYALNEADQRIGLARFGLHQKVGVTQYAGVRQPVRNPTPTPPSSPTPNPPVNPGPTSPVNPTPTPPSNPPPTPPSNPTPTPTPPSNPGPPYTPLPPYHPPYNPGLPNNNRNPYSRQDPRILPPPPPPNNGPPLPNNTQTPPYNPNYPRQPYSNPAPPNVTQTNPYNNNQGPANPSAPLPPDYQETSTRLVQVSSRSNAIVRRWGAIRQTQRQLNQPLRLEIEAALSSMQRFTQLAQQSLRAGDTAACRHYMDEAEKQMDLLQKFYDE